MAKDKNSQPKIRKPRSAHRCTSCGKEDQEHLSTCALCKCARYCNKECQVADYKARHKEECAAFVYPPMTRAFVTEPVGDEKYAQRPVFAHAYREGVGCWVSVDGEYDCDLKSLAEPMDIASEDFLTVMRRRMALVPASDAVSIGDQSKAFMRNLLTLSILVQNRRKDKTKVLVFGSQTQLVTLATTVDVLRRGRSTSNMEGIHMFEAGGNMLAAVSVAEDPWEKRPRLQIKNFDGLDIKNDTRPPAPITDAANGVVSLKPGEYVVYRIQFRVGDDDGLTTDFGALGRLAGLNLAFTLWEHGLNPTLLDYILSTTIHKDGHVPQGLGVLLDHHAIYQHYADFIEKGQEAFIESHFGRKRVDAFRTHFQSMDTIGRHMMRTLEHTDGGMDRFVAELRASGTSQEMVEKFERLRTTMAA
ncbi:hypothetical protein OH76DRAFT_1476775 [Lentinus brumalis]|nr:hypothetical protein OH76DRAFT_1476775 [Polyporus brumalis]